MESDEAEYRQLISKHYAVLSYIAEFFRVLNKVSPKQKLWLFKKLYLMDSLHENTDFGLVSDKLDSIQELTFDFVRGRVGFSDIEVRISSPSLKFLHSHFILRVKGIVFLFKMRQVYSECHDDINATLSAFMADDVL